MLGLGLHTLTLARRTRTADAGPPAFTPLDLPLAAWYDPSDLSTLFQDTAGTVPVLADGDPIALMLDKSGNGHHMSQPLATQQPLYHTSGGQHWIESDGVDDVMSTTTRLGFGADPDITILAGIEVVNDTQTTERLFHLGGAGLPGTLCASLGRGGFSWRHNNGNSIYDPVPLNTLMLARWDRDAGTDYSAARCALNGVQMVKKSSANGTRLPTNTTDEAYIFAQGSTASNALNTRLYGLIIGAFADPVNQGAAEAWMSGKFGVAVS